MLAALQVQGHNQWHNIITGDKSWSDFEYVRDRPWISSLDKSTSQVILDQLHKVVIRGRMEHNQNVIQVQI
jgi:hypothetical protein